MASLSTLPSVAHMVELRANGIGIPIVFPIDANGFASVSSFHLSIRFSLQDSIIWVEREIYDSASLLLSLTMRENPRVADNGSSIWELSAGKYRVYGLPCPSPHVATTFRTPPHSSAFTFNTLPQVKVKIEPGMHTIIDLSDSSDGDIPPISTPINMPSPSSFPSSFVTPSLLSPHPPSPPKAPFQFFNVFVISPPCPVGKTSSKS
jgi:hypothetical protein